MPVVFSQNTGRVAAISDSVASGSISLATVSSGNDTLSYQLHKTIITRVGLSAAGNFQFLHTIGNDVYVYVFGDRMGQITIHGLSFAQACPLTPNRRQSSRFQPSFDNSPLPPHGFELLYQWYCVNRIAARKAPINVIIGRGTSFSGFVTALNGDVQDSLHRTIQFQLTIATMPTPAL